MMSAERRQLAVAGQGSANRASDQAVRAAEDQPQTKVGPTSNAQSNNREDQRGNAPGEQRADQPQGGGRNRQGGVSLQQCGSLGIATSQHEHSGQDRSADRRREAWVGDQKATDHSDEYSAEDGQLIVVDPPAGEVVNLVEHAGQERGRHHDHDRIDEAWQCNGQPHGVHGTILAGAHHQLAHHGDGLVLERQDDHDDRTDHCEHDSPAGSQLAGASSEGQFSTHGKDPSTKRQVLQERILSI
ncbi:MAG TPA: hypothetical protein VK694_08020 [Verrucomicrobiae bacterium]|nr:hypothetical protein [Verrucomicrobiae bacterium]